MLRDSLFIAWPTQEFYDAFERQHRKPVIFIYFRFLVAHHTRRELPATHDMLMDADIRLTPFEGNAPT